MNLKGAVSLNNEQVAKFFANFGLRYYPVNEKPIHIQRYILIIATASRWHGVIFAQFVTNCFVAFMNSDEHYLFNYPFDEEIEDLHKVMSHIEKQKKTKKKP